MARVDTVEGAAAAGRRAAGRTEADAGDVRRPAACRLVGCCDPLHHAIAAAACAAAAVVLLDTNWIATAGGATAHIAVPGALMTASVILAFSAMLSAAARSDSGMAGQSASGDRATSGRRSARGTSTTTASTPALAPPHALLAVLAIVAVAAAAFAAATAPSEYPAGHPGIIDAMAACHATEAGCGRAAIGGEGGGSSDGGGTTAHLIAPPPVITTVGVPATVSISGSLPADARPPARVSILLTGPAGELYEHATMSTSTGRYSLHVQVDPPADPGTHQYTIAASYSSRDFGRMVDAGTVPFTIMVLQPEISRSEAPSGPPIGLHTGASGAWPAGFPPGAQGVDGLHPAGPVSIIDGIVSFDPPLPNGTISAGQVVEVIFSYTDGAARESFAHVRGPAPQYERLTEAAYAGTGTYSFVVQPTWMPGEYGVVVSYGAEGANDAAGAGTTAGILPVQVGAGAASHDGESILPSFSCITLFGRVGPGEQAASTDGGGGANDDDADVRHGRQGGCYAGIVRGVLGPDTLDIDGRPVALTVSNARAGGEVGTDRDAADRLRDTCPTGSVALVDRDDTLAVDSREPHPTIRAGYYSTVWCLGAGGVPYDGTPGRHDPVNRILLYEGLASPDPVGCLSSERRLEWPECDMYTAVEQAVGGAVSAAIDAVSSAAAGGEGAEGNDGGAAPGGDCAIATAAYGMPIAADVQSLREWRDAALFGPDAHSLSAAFAEPILHAYYAVSPAAADMLRDSPHARGVAAAALSMPVSIASAVALASAGQAQHWTVAS